jgi:hypothetical protein
MRKILSLILLSVSLLFVRAIAAQDVAKADTAATGALSGRWIVNADFFWFANLFRVAAGAARREPDRQL